MVHAVATHQHRTAHPVKESSIMKRDTRFKPGVSGNQTAKWGPGQSGNPAGKSRGRARFEEAFNEALLTQGSAEEASEWLWQAARGKEPWAIQEVCRRFAPQTQSRPVPHLPPGCSRRAGGKRPWGVRERAGAEP